MDHFARLVSLLLLTTGAAIASPPAVPAGATVCLFRDGVAASPDSVFRSGEIVSFELVVPRDGWVTLTWRSPDGGLHPLHDTPAPARAGQPVALPPLGAPSAVALTPPAAPETFLLVWSDAAGSTPGWIPLDGPPPAEATARRAPTSRPLVTSKGAAPVRAYTSADQAPECLTYTLPDATAWSLIVTLDHR